MNFYKISICLTSLLVMISTATAHFVAFNNFDEWSEAVNNDFTTIDFVLDENQFLNDQYADLGVHFPDGDDVAFQSEALFPNDGWGARGHPFAAGSITVEFDTLQQSIGVHLFESFQIMVFNQGIFIESVSTGGGGPVFSGFIFSEPFDEAVLIDQADGLVDIDDLHFGSTVPAPGALALLGMGGVLLQRRRRE